ncbi:ribose-5-phosphate isomerase [Erysipelothrix larvae]|uniref:Ribose-5-phosphate isomerase A n=1 Tax=Erysipelothrix larvae TaxID=1514105 RepID=A0A0X8H1V1_9FIRM|nr:ribose-5-phosphate isomerase RpiA [Erysipelothrix larvae]AMC94540.1 ribose-5-phosphate isomerase [Erysipelothrix larvae]
MSELKKAAALKASEYILDGMVVGLGTGSTAYYIIEELGRRVNEEGLNIVGVPTSTRSKEQAESLGIDVKEVHEVPYIDITVDGADEFDQDLNGIKGGGGALLFEKVVANHTNTNIWICDESKCVDTLGRFPLAIEVVPFATDLLFKEFEKKGYSPVIRPSETGRYITDSNNYIIDCHLESIENPYELAKQLDNTSGVVEHGLFLDIADIVIVASMDGIKTFTRD